MHDRQNVLFTSLPINPFILSFILNPLDSSVDETLLHTVRLETKEFLTIPHPSDIVS